MPSIGELLFFFYFLLYLIVFYNKVALPIVENITESNLYKLVSSGFTQVTAEVQGTVCRITSACMCVCTYNI